MSSQLWDSIDNERPLAAAVDYLRRDGTHLDFQSAGDLERPIRKLRNAVRESLHEVSAYHALPALMQATADRYFDTDMEVPVPAAALRPVFKTLAIRIAKRSEKNPGSTSAVASLQQATRLAFAETQLMVVRNAYQVVGDAESHLTPEGLHRDGDLSAALGGYNHAFGIGGRVQRLAATQVTERIFAQPDAWLDSIWQVVGGEPPSGVSGLAGTYFASLPGADEAGPFWIALGARVNLLFVARAVAAEVTLDPASIAVLNEFAINLAIPPEYGVTPQDRSDFQAQIIDCFWKRDWLRTIAEGTEPSAFVRRPLTRIDWTAQPTFVTTAYNIADSVTLLAEGAVTGSGSRELPRLPDRVFEELLSRPFEESVLAELRAYGWLAGEVTEAGAWLTQDGVRHAPGHHAPDGQIDVLAWHPPSGLLVVADCKVLRFPDQPGKQLNQWQKLGLHDVEGFRRKLRLRREWGTNLLAGLGLAVSARHALILLDRPLHFLQPEDDVLLIDANELKQALETLDGM